MAQTDWYKYWFNSPYYHVLYKNRDDREARLFLDRIVSKAGCNPGDEVMDLACGKGRHSRYLNQLGLDVTGADLSEENIKFASQFQNESLRFVRHDMRDILESNRFNFVFNVFTSFGYFGNSDDNLRVVKSIASQLKKGGTLIMDYLNAEVVIQNLIPEEIKEIEGYRFSIKRLMEGDRIVKQITVSAGSDSKTYEERVDALTLSDFKSLFQQAGLGISDTFGSYELDSFEEHSSQRLIMLVKHQL